MTATETPEPASAAPHSSVTGSLTDWRTPAPSHARQLMRVLPGWSWAFLLYVGVAVVTIGNGVLAHPGRDCACLTAGTDPEIFMWSLAWWPHAIVHGIDPFFSHAIWAPWGTNTAGATTIPAAAIVVWPVTALFGPLVAYNLLAVLSPALSALTTYLLCRRLGARPAAALIGGYIFGFSSYELGTLLGHLHLTLVFLVPVMVHLAVRRFQDDLSKASFIAALAVVFAVQTLLSDEILFDVAAIGGAALVAGFVVAPVGLRPRVDRLTGEVILAAIAALVVLLPYLVPALAVTEPFRGGDLYGLNLANLVVPTRITWLGGDLLRTVSSTFEAGNAAEAGGYLGVPLLLGFGLFAMRTWQRRDTRLLVIVAVISLLLACGSPLHIGRLRLIVLPWALLQRLPVVASVAPSRIALFAALCLAVGIAQWLSQPSHHPAGRWLLTGLGVIALLPNIAGGWWGGAPVNPAFFVDGIYRQALRPGETILTVPVGRSSTSLLWQAEDDFRYKIVGGYISDVLPNAAARNAAIMALLGGGPSDSPPPPSTAPLIRSFLHTDHIRHIVVEPAYRRAWTPILSRLAPAPVATGGVLLYTVH